jgi:hypothetical protein
VHLVSSLLGLRWATRLQSPSQSKMSAAFRRVEIKTAHPFCDMIP